MLIRNVKLIVAKIEGDKVSLHSELGQEIIVDKDFLGTVKETQTIYLAADDKPLMLTDPKEVLNEIINGQEEQQQD